MDFILFIVLIILFVILLSIYMKMFDKIENCKTLEQIHKFRRMMHYIKLAMLVVYLVWVLILFSFIVKLFI